MRTRKIRRRARLALKNRTAGTVHKLVSGRTGSVHRKRLQSRHTAK